MGHIHTEPGQYDQTVSLFIVNTAEAEPRLLLHQHRLLNLLMQPGGHVELDETHWEAAAHELREETGYDLDQLSLLQPRPRILDEDSHLLPQPLLVRTNEFWLTPGHFHEDLVYAFVTDDMPRQAVADGESENLRWVNLHELNSIEENLIIGDVLPIGRALLTNWQDWDIIPTTDFE